MDKVNVFWFRRDLRLKDNKGLYEALCSKRKVVPIFIFDTDILSQLEDKSDRRVDFIFQSLEALNSYLVKKGSGIQYFHGKPFEVFQKLMEKYRIETVFTNEDYEPNAIKRDQKISELLQRAGVQFSIHKDQVIFAKDDVVKGDGSPYTIYTPYSKKWLETYFLENHSAVPSEKFLDQLVQEIPQNFGMDVIGFYKTNLEFQHPEVNVNLIKTYDETRNFPECEGTSKLGIHLRFGTLGIRSLLEKIKNVNHTFLKELIWREFFMQVLYHFPYSAQHAFKPKYEKIQWRNNVQEFQKWCEGKTGFPIVDAGMRELNATGFMHNRVRMIVASFLVKDLLIDWKWGEMYFAKKLLDYDQSANVGNWQWAAGTGCDAAPYFRVFNPDEQQKKFDPKMNYIKKWIPELGTTYYPTPMIDHKTARLRALEVYKKAVNE